MSVGMLEMPAAKTHPALADPRVLGTAAMLASPVFLVQALVLGAGDHAGHALAAVLNLLFLSGWICSLIGLRLLRATGEGGLIRALFGVHLLSLSLAASQEVQDLLYGYANWSSPFYQIADAAWPFSVLLMLVVGGFTLRARVWRGWRRFTPLLCGLVLPLLMGVGAMAGEEAMRIAGALVFTGAWLMLGYAVRTGQR